MPNPNRGHFYIDGLQKTKALISIYDMQGRLIIKQHSVALNQELYYPELSSGLGMINLTEEGLISTQVLKLLIK